MAKVTIPIGPNVQIFNRSGQAVEFGPHRSLKIFHRLRFALCLGVLQYVAYLL